MNERKILEALEQIKSLTEIPFCHAKGNYDLIYKVASEAMPQVAVSGRNQSDYEELRAIIDGGSEIMTHADAVEWCKRHADSDWIPVSRQQPATTELTDSELMDVARPACGNFRWPSTALDIMRQAIAAHEAKRSRT